MGKYTAYDETHTVTVSDGELNMDFSPVIGDATIGAILVMSGGLLQKNLALSPQPEPSLPENIALSQNYPNPFNAFTTIQFQLPEAVYTTIRVYDMMGKEIATLLNQQIETSYHQVTWDGRDRVGNLVSSGIYLIRMVAGTYTSTHKMILIK